MGIMKWKVRRVGVDWVVEWTLVWRNSWVTAEWKDEWEVECMQEEQAGRSGRRNGIGKVAAKGVTRVGGGVKSQVDRRWTRCGGADTMTWGGGGDKDFFSVGVLCCVWPFSCLLHWKRRDGGESQVAWRVAGVWHYRLWYCKASTTGRHFPNKINGRRSLRGIKERSR